MDQDQERKLALWRKGCLRFVEQKQSVAPELEIEQRQERLSVGPRVKAASTVGRADPWAEIIDVRCSVKEAFCA